MCLVGSGYLESELATVTRAGKEGEEGGRGAQTGTREVGKLELYSVGFTRSFGELRRIQEVERRERRLYRAVVPVLSVDPTDCNPHSTKGQKGKRKMD